ncbi:MAG: DUF4058 family protein [Cyanothece sp. SIO1E1]|nr:DUF4058 family protein [Cyanothece sp. SIO1E1]
MLEALTCSKVRYSRRSADRPDVALYEFDLPEPIPGFPVPLQPGEPEPIVNLQRLVNEIYT